MLRKAQNLVEMSLLATVVVVIAISVWAIYNNNKMNLANLSKVNVSTQGQSQDGGTILNGHNPNEKIPYQQTETAGALSNILSNLDLSEEELNSLMANITYQDMLDAMSPSGTNQDIAKLANDLITQLGLSNDKITKDNVDSDTLTTLAEIMNKVSTPEYENDTTAKAFVERFKTLVGISAS